MGEKGKNANLLKLNGKKIISFHLSKTLHKPNNCVKFQNFLSKNIKIIPHFVFKMLNFVIFKHKSENHENMEIAQGVLGNYALVFKKKFLYFIMYVL